MIAHDLRAELQARGIIARQRMTAFWFDPIPPAHFVLFRTTLGMVTMIWFATLLPDLTSFFGTAGLGGGGGLEGTTWLNVFRWFTGYHHLWAAALLGLVASSLLVLGRLTKVTAPILAVLVSSFMADNPLVWNVGDVILRTFLLLFAVFCALTPAAALDVGLRRGRSDARWEARHRWIFRLIQIQTTVIYVGAFLHKVPGEMWQNGTATTIVFRLESMQRFFVPDLFRHNLVIGNITTWATLALEGLLPVLLWHRAARPYAVAAAVVFHLAIDWTLTVGLFSWVMTLGLITFVDPQRVAAAHRKVGETRHAIGLRGTG